VPEPVFGTLADRRRAHPEAHELCDIRVIIDLVASHTSSEHPWFRAGLAAPRGHSGAGPLPLPRRSGPGRVTAAEQLDVQFRRARPIRFATGQPFRTVLCDLGLTSNRLVVFTKLTGKSARRASGGGLVDQSQAVNLNAGPDDSGRV
jgi:hypothetical protein